MDNLRIYLSHCNLVTKHDHQHVNYDRIGHVNYDRIGHSYEDSLNKILDVIPIHYMVSEYTVSMNFSVKSVPVASAFCDLEAVVGSVTENKYSVIEDDIITLRFLIKRLRIFKNSVLLGQERNINLAYWLGDVNRLISTLITMYNKNETHEYSDSLCVRYSSGYQMPLRDVRQVIRENLK